MIAQKGYIQRWSALILALLCYVVWPLAVSGAAVLTVSAPTVEVDAGETFDIDIQASDLTGAGVSAFSFTLTYDPSLVVATGVTVEGTLSSGLSLISNTNTPGIVVVAAAGIDALSGAGAIVRIQFESLSSEGTGAFDISDFLFNEGNPTANVTDGQVTVKAFLPGDASLNGEVTAFDASEVLKHVAEIQPLSADGLKAADVTGNAEVTSFDASKVLQRVAGIITCFPVESGCSAGKSAVAASAELRIGDKRKEPAGWVVPLDMQHASGEVYALDASISVGTASPATLRSGLPADWVFTWGVDEDGMLHLSMAGASPLRKGSIEVVFLSDPPSLAEGTYRVNENAIQEIEEPATNQPASFQLHQNYPNPFNPQTTIAFSLAAPAFVTLEVFDMLGRSVLTLVEAPRQAGSHEVSLDASSLPSGAYFYQIQAGGYVQTRRMTLLK